MRVPRTSVPRFLVCFVAVLAVLAAARPARTAAPAPPTCGDRACHGALVKRDRAHSPVQDGDCGSCHRAVAGASHPDSSRADFTLVKRGAALCADCHDPFAGSSVHAPVEEGECLACHDPHGSGRPALARREVNAMCFECHEAKSFAVHAVVGVDLGSGHPLSGPRDPARKSGAFSCASCHDPHATNTPHLWKFGATTTFDLCGHCHQK